MITGFVRSRVLLVAAVTLVFIEVSTIGVVWAGDNDDVEQCNHNMLTYQQALIDRCPDDDFHNACVIQAERPALDWDHRCIDQVRRGGSVMSPPSVGGYYARPSYGYGGSSGSSNTSEGYGGFGH